MITRPITLPSVESLEKPSQHAWATLVLEQLLSIS